MPVGSGTVLTGTVMGAMAIVAAPWMFASAGGHVQPWAMFSVGVFAAGVPSTALTSPLVVRLQSVLVVDPPLEEELDPCEA
jgi:hypothetical protein